MRVFLRIMAEMDLFASRVALALLHDENQILLETRFAAPTCFLALKKVVNLHPV